jgi:hypothetical protein
MYIQKPGVNRHLPGKCNSRIQLLYVIELSDRPDYLSVHRYELFKVEHRFSENICCCAIGNRLTTIYV